MPLKPIHIALGIGAVLLLRKKSEASIGSIERAGALSTAELTQQARGPQKVADIQAQQISLLTHYLVPGHVGVAPFSATNLPTLGEYAILYAIDRTTPWIPAEMKRLYWNSQTAPSIRYAAQSIGTEPQRKIAAALTLMTPGQVREFAADCLEIALPAFQKDFPHSTAGQELVAAIRSFARKEMTSANLRWYTEQVLACYPTLAARQNSLFARASVLATVTKDTYGALAQSDPMRVKEMILSSLSLTKKIVTDLKGSVAFRERLTFDRDFARYHAAYQKARNVATHGDPFRDPSYPEASSISERSLEQAEKARRTAIEETEAKILQFAKKKL